MLSRKNCVTLSAVIFLGLAVFEAIHDLGPSSWGTFSHQVNWVGAIYVPIFFITSIRLFQNKTDEGWLASVIGMAAALIHGVFIKVGDSNLGLIFAGAAFASLALIYRSHIWTMREAQPLDRSVPATQEQKPPSIDRFAA